MKWLLDLAIALIIWLWDLWRKLPEEVKEEIIDKITETFEVLFRGFYRWFKEA